MSTCNQSELFKNDDISKITINTTCNMNNNIFNASSSLIDQATKDYIRQQYQDAEEGLLEERQQHHQIKCINQLQSEIERRVTQKLTYAFNQKFKALQGLLRQEIRRQINILKFAPNNQTIIEPRVQMSAINLNQSDIRGLAEISFNHHKEQEQISKLEAQQKNQVQQIVQAPSAEATSINNTQQNTQKNSLMKTGTFQVFDINLPVNQMTDDFKSTNSIILPKNLIQSFDKTCLQDNARVTKTPKHKEIISNIATPTVTSGANQQTPNQAKNLSQIITPGLKFYAQPQAATIPFLKCQNTISVKRDLSQNFTTEKHLPSQLFTSFSQSNSKNRKINARYSNAKDKEENEQMQQNIPFNSQRLSQVQNKRKKKEQNSNKISVEYAITQPNHKPQQNQKQEEYFYYLQQMEDEKQILSFGERFSFKNDRNPLITSENSETVDFLFLHGNRSPDIETERNIPFTNRGTSSILKSSILSVSQMRPTFKKILPKVAQSGHTDFQTITSGLSQKKPKEKINKSKSIKQLNVGTEKQQQILKLKKYNKFITRTSKNLQTVQSADETSKINIFDGVKKKDHHRTSGQNQSYLSTAQMRSSKVLLELPINTQRQTVFETRKPSFSPLVGSSQFNDKENQNFIQNGRNCRKGMIQNGSRLFQSLKNRQKQNQHFFESWRRSGYNSCYAKGLSIKNSIGCQRQNSSQNFMRKFNL